MSCLRGGDFRVGLLAGFHYLNQTVTDIKSGVDAGVECTQIAFNPPLVEIEAAERAVIW